MRSKPASCVVHAVPQCLGRQWPSCSQISHRSGKIIRLRQNRVFQFWLVRAEGIHRRYTLYRSIQLVKQFFRDARRYFRSVAPAQHIFVRYDHSMILLHGPADGFPVVRRERAQIDNFNRYAFPVQRRSRSRPPACSHDSFM